MDRGAWHVTVHVTAKVGHDCRDLAHMHERITSPLKNRTFHFHLPDVIVTLQLL